MHDAAAATSTPGWQGARDLPIMVGLCLLVALVYANGWSASFQFDDFNVIVDNPRVHGLAAWWRELPSIRPLLKLSYALNWMASPQARGFHAVNIVIHALNTMLVWAWAALCLRQLHPERTIPRWAPIAVAVLFALHPAATEAVTYVSGRSLSLMASFYLASLLAHAIGREQARPVLSLWLSPLLFALALAVRETAVTLPLAILLLAWSRGKSLREELRALRVHLAVLALAAVAAAAMPAYRRFFSWSLGTRDALAQIAGQAEAHSYLWLHTVLGLGTNIDPDLRVPAVVSLPLLASALGLAITIGLAFGARRRWPWLSFGLLWYLLQLAPSNSLLPRFDLANDRHLYLALPGIALALVALTLRLRSRGIALSLLLAAAVAAGFATVRRNQEYRTELALWQATVRASPNKPRPWTNLGYARQLSGDRAGARRAYACALALDPDNAQAITNLAVLDASPGGIPAEAAAAAALWPAGMHCSALR